MMVARKKGVFSKVVIKKLIYKLVFFQAFLYVIVANQRQLKKTINVDASKRTQNA